MQVERAEVLAASEREVHTLQTEVDGTRAQLREATETSGALRQRAEELGDRQVTPL